MSQPHPFHEFPKHLFHQASHVASLLLTASEEQTLSRIGFPGNAVIAHNAAEEKLARLAGYGDEYVPQEYPKYLDGKLVTAPEEKK